jgi:hypothetical protein
VQWMAGVVGPKHFVNEYFAGCLSCVANYCVPVLRMHFHKSLVARRFWKFIPHFAASILRQMTLIPELLAKYSPQTHAIHWRAATCSEFPCGEVIDARKRVER